MDSAKEFFTDMGNVIREDRDKIILEVLNMCCDEYKKFLEMFGNIPVDYDIVKGKGVRVLLKYAVDFKRCPYCFEKFPYAENLPPKKIER